MSIRYCCDVCGKDLTNVDRVRKRLFDVAIEVMVRYKGTWNAGHICPSCVAEVAIKGTDVPLSEGYSSTPHYRDGSITVQPWDPRVSLTAGGFPQN